MEIALLTNGEEKKPFMCFKSFISMTLSFGQCALEKFSSAKRKNLFRLRSCTCQYHFSNIFAVIAINLQHTSVILIHYTISFAPITLRFVYFIHPRSNFKWMLGTLVDVSGFSRFDINLFEFFQQWSTLCARNVVLFQS